jgi:arylsulfatase A-like enzyme
MALSGLLEDLSQRGMLDETLVLINTEHGRPPKMTAAGGRDHWSDVYSCALAGGGAKGGTVVGKSDDEAGQPVEHPVSPKDLLATAYHLLGIDPRTEIMDRLARPLPLVPDAKVDEALIA